jgi:hypothetical protein
MLLKECFYIVKIISLIVIGVSLGLIFVYFIYNINLFLFENIFGL